MARKSKKYHYIYKTTNLKTGKFYVGMHSTNNLNDGYLGSGTRLRRSIRRNGKHNFKIEILEFLPNRSSLIRREKELVNEEFIKHPMCMNLKPGGTGGFCNEDHKASFLQGAKKNQLSNLEKGRETQTLLWKTNEDWAHFRKEINRRSLSLIETPAFLNRRHSEETKIKIGKTNSEKQRGDRNSQFGTMWITDKKHNKKIKKDDQIPKGWKKGRT